MSTITIRVDELLSEGLGLGEAIAQAATEKDNRVDPYEAARKAAGV